MKSDRRIRLDEVEVDLVAEQFSDIVDAVPIIFTHITVSNLSKSHSIPKPDFTTYLIIVGLSRLNPQP